jgi:hypothetical protein
VFGKWRRNRLFCSRKCFLTGTFEIKSIVTIYLDGNSKIIGSNYLKNYPYDVDGCPYGEVLSHALIYEIGTENIALIGIECIDGYNRGIKNK